MQKERKRSEVENKYKWDLSKIYKDDESFFKDYELLDKSLDELTNYKGHVLDSPKSLLQALNKNEEFERKLERLYLYASLKNAEDTTNSTYQELKSKADSLWANYETKNSYLLPEILKSSYENILELIKEEPDLEEYRFYLENIFHEKDHTLSVSEEKLLATFSKALSCASETSDMLRDADLTFEPINDNGKLLPLRGSNFNSYMENPNRDIRKQAFKNIYATYAGLKNTFASLYASEVEANNKVAQVRHYNSAKECALHRNHIDPKIYDNLIKTVSDNIDVIDDYYELKKEVLGLDELHIYDTYAPLIKTNSKEYSFSEAKDLVIKALSILGDDYVANLNKAFTEGWIDSYPNLGKRGGAFSSGGYDTDPYLLLNFQNTYDDVSTLAHELGHSMHSYYSNKNNLYRYANYRIFVAEVASTVNEILLANYVLNNSKDVEEKQAILDSQMQMFKSTLIRQTMFAEFEDLMHQKSSEGIVLTEKFLTDEYYRLNKKYYGKNVIVDDEIRYEWSRIPHFYMNFYVYQYATGISAATYIATEILKGNDKMRENYLAFLKLGGSVHSLDALKVAGVDMKDEKVIVNALNYFRDLINKFKETLKK